MKYCKYSYRAAADVVVDSYKEGNSKERNAV